MDFLVAKPSNFPIVSRKSILHSGQGQTSILELDVEGKVCDANQGICSLSGFSLEEIIDKPISFLLGTDHATYLKAWLLAENCSLAQQAQFQTTLLEKEGSQSWVEVSLIKKITSPDNSPHLIISIHKINAKNLFAYFSSLLNSFYTLETRYYAFENLVRGISESLDIPYVMIGEYDILEGKVHSKAFWAKDHFRQLSIPLRDTNYQQAFYTSEPFFLGKTVKDLFSEDPFFHEKVLNSCYVLPFIDSHENIIGHLILTWEKYQEIPNDQSSQLHTFSQHIAWELEKDLYQQQQAKSLERFQTLAQNAPMGICLCTPEGIISFANPAYSQIIGYPLEDIIGKSFKVFTHEEDADANMDTFKEVITDERISATFEKRYQHQNGAIVWVKITISRMEIMPDRKVEVIAIIENITQQKNQEEKVKMMHLVLDRQRFLMEEGEKVSQSSTWIWDLEDRTLIHSPELINLYGIDTKELIEHDAVDLMRNKLTDEDQKRFGEAMYATIRENKNHIMDFQIQGPDGTAKWLRCTFSPWKVPQKVLGTTTDITEEKQTLAELLKTQDELEQWIYTVSHDLRTPLGHIEAFSEWLMEEAKTKLSLEGIGYLKGIMNASHRMDTLTRGLLDYAWRRKVELQKSWIDLNPILESCKPSDKIKEAPGRIIWSIEKLPMIYADKDMMITVFENLFSNAIKFSFYREVIHIKVQSEVDKDNIYIKVIDNGVGFEIEKIDHLFTFFKRLHSYSEYEGTGIGLANVKQILSRHGGTITAFSEKGNGATFTIGLPHPPKT